MPAHGLGHQPGGGLCWRQHRCVCPGAARPLPALRAGRPYRLRRAPGAADLAVAGRGCSRPRRRLARHVACSHEGSEAGPASAAASAAADLWHDSADTQSAGGAADAPLASGAAPAARRAARVGAAEPPAPATQAEADAGAERSAGATPSAAAAQAHGAEPPKEFGPAWLNAFENRVLEPAWEVAGILGSAVWWTLVEGIEAPLAAQRRRTRALQAAADADPADAAKCAPVRRAGRPGCEGRLRACQSLELCCRSVVRQHRPARLVPSAVAPCLLPHRRRRAVDAGDACAERAGARGLRACTAAWPGALAGGIMTGDGAGGSMAQVCVRRRMPLTPPLVGWQVCGAGARAERHGRRGPPGRACGAGPARAKPRVRGGVPARARQHRASGRVCDGGACEARQLQQPGLRTQHLSCVSSPIPVMSSGAMSVLYRALAFSLSCRQHVRTDCARACSHSGLTFKEARCTGLVASCGLCGLRVAHVRLPDFIAMRWEP